MTLMVLVVDPEKSVTEWEALVVAGEVPMRPILILLSASTQDVPTVGSSENYPMTLSTTKKDHPHALVG